MNFPKKRKTRRSCLNFCQNRTYCLRYWNCDDGIESNFFAISSDTWTFWWKRYSRCSTYYCGTAYNKRERIMETKLWSILLHPAKQCHIQFLVACKVVMAERHVLQLFMMICKPYFGGSIHLNSRGSNRSQKKISRGWDRSRNWSKIIVKSQWMFPSHQYLHHW